MFERITLEFSMKLFSKTDDAFIRETCEKMFLQWRPLIKDRKHVSVLFWVGDGSEMLDYDGNDDTAFEWGYYLGTANCPDLGDLPKETSLHFYRQLYKKNPPKMTYGIIRKIVRAFRAAGKKICPEAKLTIGNALDIGPEFSESDFKYKRHPEICTGSLLDGLGFVDATATLNADDRYYAAYPNGILEGTPVGTFFGRQCDRFLKDLGFDFLWLSNGLGFSSNPWVTTGKIFDGKDFYPEKLSQTSEKVFRFWKLFRKECDLPLMVRGTNNSVGIDYATDGVPLYDVYSADFDIEPPPNSPWAALNDDFGLELMGHMTRICELPKGKDGFLFRFYLHDIWWVNSPWYDRYNGYPMDIYLPMAVSRIDENGNAHGASMLNLCVVNNSFGELPDHCANESLPHFLKAEKISPDEPAPLVWVYPMREYTTAKDKDSLRRMYEGDNYIRKALNWGVPLNCVVSTDNFLKHGDSIYKKSVLISPIPENGEVREKLKSFAQNGIKIIFCGAEKERERVADISSVFVSYERDVEGFHEALRGYGYDIRFEMKPSATKPALITCARQDNAYWFSVYNPNTTTVTYLRYPLGAPIMIGGETELVDGYAKYHFARSENKECRLFVGQKEGVIRCKERAPISGRFRRRIYIDGLEDATVCIFGETYCQDDLYFSQGDNADITPVLDDDRFMCVHSEEYGTYYRGEHISGSIAVLMEHRPDRFD